MTTACREAPTPYEQGQIDQIRAWHREPPGVIERASAVALSPVARLLTRLVPSAAIEALLRASDWMAAKTIPASQTSADGDLQQLDTEARAIRNWAIAYAGSEGAVAGAVGLMSLPVDLPAIITLSLRTIRRIGATYGYAASGEQERQFIYAVLSVASANSVQQKREALIALRGLETQMLARNWAAIGERAARRGVGAESILLLARDVAEQLGFNLTRRKALAALPLVGAAMGATVNGWYMRDIAAAAQRTYQQRWLEERGLYCDQ
jgi:EcsC protein family